MAELKTRLGFWDIVKIQAVVCFFSVIGVLSKTASGFPFLSARFFLIYSLVLSCFMVYAFFWQKLLMRYPLFSVYANRSLLVVWSLIWAVVLFNETVTLFNIIGVVIIIAGILVISHD
jgi:drug/metabolite transporter (DMT)-like permease